MYEFYSVKTSNINYNINLKDNSQDLPVLETGGFMNVFETVGNGGKFVVTGVIDKFGLSLIKSLAALSSGDICLVRIGSLKINKNVFIFEILSMQWH